MPHVTSTQEYDLGIQTSTSINYGALKCPTFESGMRNSEDKSVHLHSHVAY